MSDKSNNLTVKQYRSLEEAHSEVERELNVRSRCFPQWIADGRVNRIDAQDRLDRLATAFQLLRWLIEDADRSLEAQIFLHDHQASTKQ
jgi:hypothetical protein